MSKHLLWLFDYKQFIERKLNILQLYLIYLILHSIEDCCT